MMVVLSSRQLSLTFIIPETSSWVTLAALGTVFQTNHVGCLVVLLFVILIQSTKSQNNNIKHLNFRYSVMREL